MTRVAIFTDIDLDRPGAVPAALRATLRHAQPHVRPRIFTAADFADDSEEHFAAASISIRAPWSPLGRLFCPRVHLFARQLRACGIDVVHIATPGPIGLAGRWVATRAGLPMTGSVHDGIDCGADGDPLPPRIAGAFERLARWGYHECRSLLVSSEALARALAARGFAHVKPWAPGVDTERFHPGRASIGLREQWHVDHRRPAIVVPMDRLTSRERRVLECVRQGLYRHAVAHQFVFLDAPGGEPLRESCPEGVFFEGLSEDERAIAMASADLCLFPGESDVASGCVLESQACGVPVLVPDTGAALEQIVDDQTGCLVKHGDVADMVARVVSLLRNAARRVALGRQARAYSLTRDWASAALPVYAAWSHAAGVRESAPLHAPAGAHEAA